MRASATPSSNNLTLGQPDGVLKTVAGPLHVERLAGLDSSDDFVAIDDDEKDRVELLLLAKTQIARVERTRDPAAVRPFGEEDEVVAGIGWVLTECADDSAQTESNAFVHLVGSLAIGGISHQQGLSRHELAVFRALHAHVIVLKLLDQAAHDDCIIELAGDGERLLQLDELWHRFTYEGCGEFGHLGNRLLLQSPQGARFVGDVLFRQSMRSAE